MQQRIRSWVRANSPSRESLENSRVFGGCAQRVLAPELWRFTRRSVPRGVALGLLVGIFFIIPGVQIAGAALLALPFRANVPVAAAMTLLSNPVTTPFILWLSVYLGNLMLQRGADMAGFAALIESHAGAGQWLHWLVSDAAPALLSGLALVSVLTAVVGYVLATLLWRMHLWRKWQARRSRAAPARKNQMTADA